MIAIPNMDKPKKVDGIKIDFHFEDGHIESHIIDIEEIIDIVTCGEECKHCIKGEGMPFCDIWLREVEADIFCSYGKRSE